MIGVTSGRTRRHRNYVIAEILGDVIVEEGKPRGIPETTKNGRAVVAGRCGRGG